jgi:predicted dehydrogenase
VLGANDIVNFGMIAMGGITRGHVRDFQKLADKKIARVVAVCDIYKPRLEWGVSATGGRGYHDYRDLLADKSIDAVLISSPDHWHAPMAIDAMRAGKDVDVEKPMSLTIDEARQMVKVSQETGRLLAVDTELCARDIWKIAQSAIRKGVLGKVLWSQTSRSRNTPDPPWQYKIDADASPKNLDWDRFIGPAPKRPFNLERFFRWRRYWDYSGGIATDLYYHFTTPFIKALGCEFPVRGTGAGGNWLHSAEVCEVPETFTMTLDFPSKHTLMVGGSLANSIELPMIIRGHGGNMFFLGESMDRSDYLVIEPEDLYIEECREKIRQSGLESSGKWLDSSAAGLVGVIRNDTGRRVEKRQAFRIDTPRGASLKEDFISCMRTREKPVVDGQLGFMSQVAVGLAVESFRQNRVMFFDPVKLKVVQKPA